jgi:hypothetical protein
MVGIMIDCCAPVTTMAAMTNFEASRKRVRLAAPAVIVLCCTGLSIVANYEDAALLSSTLYIICQ